MALDNSQYNLIMAQYDEKQFRRNQLQGEKHDELCIRIPEYRFLEDEYSSACVEKTRLLFKGTKEAIDEVSDRIKDISGRKKQLMLENGFPEDFLFIPYECDVCRDTGFVDGKPCECFNKAAATLLLKEYNSNEDFVHQSFENFDMSLFPDDLIDKSQKISSYMNIIGVINKSKKFINDFSLPYEDRTYKNLYVYGLPGVGKTFLINCITKEIIKLGKPVHYISSPDLFELLSAYHFGKSDTPKILENRINKIKNDPLLVIDDLGTEHVNNFTQSQLYALVNYRMNKGLSTIISSNVSFKDIQEIYDERIFSRVTGEYLLIRLFGNDLRQSKNLVEN